MEGPPQYVLHMVKSRTIIPKIVIFLVLGIIFYIGVLLNISLLEMSASNETTAKIITLVLLILIILIGIYLTIRHSKIPYEFYRTNVKFGDKSINYRDIAGVSTKRDIWDKMFKTYSINLSNKFHIKHIPNTIPLEDYVNKLVNYAHQMS